MNSLVRAFVLGFSLFAASLASAKSFTATLTAVDSKSYLNATAIVNYRARTLTLTLQPRMPECPEGRMCIQAFPPARTTTYQRVKSFENACGVITTTATSNKAQIVLVNNSQNTCENEPEVIAYLDLKNREGQSIDAFMSARDLDVTLQGGPVGRYTSGHLFLNRATGDVNLSLTPALELFFTNAVTTTTSCGVVQTVTSAVYNDSVQQFFTIIINDNRKNTCPTFAPLAAWDVLVRSSEDAGFSETSVIEVDQLKTKEMN